MKLADLRGVSASMHRTARAACLVILVACGGPQQPQGGGGSAAEPAGVVTDTRTEIERRRDTACQQLEPRLVQCAVDDARAEHEAGRMSKQDFAANTSADVRAKLGDEWMKACTVEMSSRQVRVLEVCFQEEAQCGPLLACLEHLNDKAPAPQ